MNGLPSYILERREASVAFSMPQGEVPLRPPGLRQLARLLAGIADQMDPLAPAVVHDEHGVAAPGVVRSERLVPRFDYAPGPVTDPIPAKLRTLGRRVSEALGADTALLYDAADEIERLRTLLTAGE
jgi:hypothetical protein